MAPLGGVARWRCFRCIGGSLWLMGWTWEKLRGIEAMGLGDVKMMFMVGAYLGWRLTILTIFIGVFSGSVIGIVVMMAQGRKDLKIYLPFGIFLESARSQRCSSDSKWWNGTRDSSDDCRLAIGLLSQ